MHTKTHTVSTLMILLQVSQMSYRSTLWIAQLAFMRRIVLCLYHFNLTVIHYKQIQVQSPKADVSRLPASKHTAANSGRESKLQGCTVYKWRKNRHEEENQFSTGLLTQHCCVLTGWINLKTCLENHPYTNYTNPYFASQVNPCLDLRTSTCLYRKTRKNTE